MRTLILEVDEETTIVPGVIDIDGEKIELDANDAHDLNELSSITATTAVGEQVRVTVDYDFTDGGMLEDDDPAHYDVEE